MNESSGPSKPLRRPLTRSEQMARIRGKHTRPEVIVADILEDLAPEATFHTAIGTVHPDVVFETERLAVFIDGCFWHGCPAHYTRPRTRTDYWAAHLAANVARDIRQTRALKALGWRVARVWEHQVLEDPLEAVLEILRLRDLEEPFGQRWVATRVEACATSDTLEAWILVDLFDPTHTRELVRERTTSRPRRR